MVCCGDSFILFPAITTAANAAVSTTTTTTTNINNTTTAATTTTTNNNNTTAATTTTITTTTTTTTTATGDVTVYAAMYVRAIISSDIMLKIKCFIFMKCTSNLNVSERKQRLVTTKGVLSVICRDFPLFKQHVTLANIMRIPTLYLAPHWWPKYS
jgi:hypothetical protein